MERPIHTNEFWETTSIQFTDSKEDVWALIDAKIEKTELKPTRVISFNKSLFAIACGLVLLLGAGFFAKFYTTSITNMSSSMMMQKLPDGSTVKLQANTSITYKPFWWYMNRELNFEGEAFFNVEKGSNFAVLSENGTTQVLGTSFNVYATKNEYNVFCKTGKVRVYSKVHNKQFILTPGTSIDCNKNTCTENDNKKTTSLPPEAIYLKQVDGLELFSQVEKIYGISIKNKEAIKNSISFTGNLKPTRSLEETNEILEQVLEISIEKINHNTYIVEEKL